MEQPNDTRLSNDSCSYKEKLKRSIGPGLYSVNVPYNDCNACAQDVPNDPYLRYQTWGQNSCTMGRAVDDSSELLGLNYKNSKCNADNFLPEKYKQSGCFISGEKKEVRSCAAPTEDCRLSNPPSTLRGTGINRWEWLCFDPQERAIEGFDRIGVNYRMVAKDNHCPVIDVPLDVSPFFPQNSEIINGNDLDKWKEINKNNVNYQAGYPYGNVNYNMPCKT